MELLQRRDNKPTFKSFYLATKKKNILSTQSGNICPDTFTDILKLFEKRPVLHM